MRSIVLFLLSLICCSAFCQSKKLTTEILSKETAKFIFNDSVCRQYKIMYNIKRVYSYTDKSGQYYTLLTESIDSISPRHDTVKYNIKAFNFKIEKGEMKDQWTLNDSRSGAESSIWFWTRYSELHDVDHDTILDPIIVYGTMGPNGYADGRTTIMVFYGDIKTGIHHQNGLHGRSTQIDKDFYNLPLAIQNKVREIMTTMAKNHHAVFTNGWEKDMDVKREFMEERK